MKKSAVLILLLVLALLVIGCTRNQTPTGYAAYGQPQQQQNPYYGGGCGVAPAENLGAPTEGFATLTLNL